MSDKNNDINTEINDSDENNKVSIEFYLNFVNNHLFSDELTNERITIFFENQITKDEEHGFNENGQLINDLKLKKKLVVYLINDISLFLDNIPKIKFIILTDKSSNQNEKDKYIEKLNNLIDESQKRIENNNLDSIINQFLNTINY